MQHSMPCTAPRSPADVRLNADADTHARWGDGGGGVEEALEIAVSTHTVPMYGAVPDKIVCCPVHGQCLASLAVFCNIGILQAMHHARLMCL